MLGEIRPCTASGIEHFFISGVSWSKGTLIVSPGFKFVLLIRVKLTTVVVYWLKGGCSITDWLLRPLNFNVPSFLLCATDDGDVIDPLCLSERKRAVTIENRKANGNSKTIYKAQFNRCDIASGESGQTYIPGIRRRDREGCGQ